MVGIGLGVSDLEHTATYIDTELAMRSMHDNYEPSSTNPLGNGPVLRASQLIAHNARRKLAKEQDGTVEDPSAALLRAISDTPKSIQTEQ